MSGGGRGGVQGPGGTGPTPQLQGSHRRGSPLPSLRTQGEAASRGLGGLRRVFPPRMSKGCAEVPTERSREDRGRLGWTLCQALYEILINVYIPHNHSKAASPSGRDSGAGGPTDQGRLPSDPSFLGRDRGANPLQTPRDPGLRVPSVQAVAPKALLGGPSLLP